MKRHYERFVSWTLSRKSGRNRIVISVRWGSLTRGSRLFLAYFWGQRAGKRVAAWVQWALPLPVDIMIMLCCVG